MWLVRLKIKQSRKRKAKEQRQEEEELFNKKMNVECVVGSDSSWIQERWKNFPCFTLELSA